MFSNSQHKLRIKLNFPQHVYFRLVIFCKLTERCHFVTYYGTTLATAFALIQGSVYNADVETVLGTVWIMCGVTF